jgi:exosortase C (VPDSG-CTERM-specific)
MVQQLQTGVPQAETLTARFRRRGKSAWAAWLSLPDDERRCIRQWAMWTVLGTIVFAKPLFRLVMLASETPLHSHIPLVPVIAAYLLYQQREKLPGSGRPAWALAALAVSVSAVAVASGWRASAGSTDALALFTFGYVTYIVAGGFIFFGRPWMASAAFPLAFLVFFVPLPDAAVAWIEQALVLASADVSAWMLHATGTPMLREGTVFRLPTIVLEVARECSGIRSTWVLFITSAVASHMFLKSPWRRFALIAFVIPLGILRNGFRILVIALLCVHVGPHMVDSFIHHQGGPIFFLLSLVPLFLLLTWLRRRDQRRFTNAAKKEPLPCHQ